MLFSKATLKIPKERNSQPLSFRFIKLKGLNKLKSPTRQRLSISSQYIGAKDNMFGMFTTKMSTKGFVNRRSNLLKPFTNSRLSSMIDNSHEGYERFREIPIEDLPQMKKSKLLNAMLYKYAFRSMDIPQLFETSFLNYLEARQARYLPVKRYENLNCSDTFTLRIQSESELNDTNRDYVHCQLSPNQTPMNLIHNANPIMPKCYSTINMLQRSGPLLKNSTCINEESRSKPLID